MCVYIYIYTHTHTHTQKVSRMRASSREEPSSTNITRRRENMTAKLEWNDMQGKHVLVPLCSPYIPHRIHWNVSESPIPNERPATNRLSRGTALGVNG